MSIRNGLVISSLIFFSLVAGAASPTALVESEILIQDAQRHDSNLNREAFRPTFRSSFVSSHPDVVRLTQSKVENCATFFKTMQNLEREVLYSLGRSAAFIQSHDKDISKYYRIRYLMSAFFLRRLTQIFSNGFEGGADFDSNKIACPTSNRPELLGKMMARDRLIHYHAHQNFESELINPLTTDLLRIEDLKSTIGNRRFVGQTMFTAAKILSLSIGYARFSAWLGESVTSLWIRRAIKGAVVGGATTAYFMSDSTPELTFEDDAELQGSENQKPNYLGIWERTLVHTQLTLAKDPDVEVIDAFIAFQEFRKKNL